MTFTVVVTGSAPFSYQWRKDGSDISGATALSLTIDEVTAEDGGAFDVVVLRA